jgi:hypothetical protein
MNVWRITGIPCGRVAYQRTTLNRRRFQSLLSSPKSRKALILALGKNRFDGIRIAEDNAALQST